MNGAVHEQRRSWLTPLFSQKSIQGYQEDIAAGCADFLDTWVPETTIELLSEMRRLALLMLGRVLLGRASAHQDCIALLVEELLALRRAIGEDIRQSQRGRLTLRLSECGDQLENALRTRIRECRDGAAGVRCLLSRMCGAQWISDDEMIGHVTAILLAGSEPVAVCLTWTLLLLSQFQDCDAGVRLDWVIKESLRLFPPNAIMTRLTVRPCELDGYSLPANFQVILSPWISHHDEERFPRSEEFVPERWATARPTRFEYLPFGAGSKHCLGSQLGMAMATTSLQMMLARYRFLRLGDEPVDWKISVTLMPASDILVRLRPRRG